MATATERRTRPMPSVSQLPEPQKPRPRWRFRLLAAGFLLLLVLVVCLPTIASNSPIVQMLIAQATDDLQGEVAVGTIHLGWFSPPVLADLEIRDTQGHSLVAIQQVRAERSLLSLLLNTTDLGKIQIEKPKLSVSYDGSTTNLEEVFGKWLEGDSSQSEIGVEVIVTGGTVTLTDTRSSQKWQVSQFDLAASVPTDANSPVDLRASGQVADSQHAGRFALELVLNRTTTRDDPLSAIESLKAEIDDTPLEMLAPLLARSLPGTKLAGRLSAFAKCELTDDGTQPGLDLQLTAQVDNFLLAGNAIHGDRLAVDRVEAGGHAQWHGRLVDIERLRVQTELGNVVMSGGFEIPDDSLSTLFKSLAEQTYQIEAALNLAALAAKMPNTLRLQEGMQVQSGDLTIALQSRRDADQMRWEGHADLSQLAAERLGRQITWPEPIRATLSATKNAQGLSIERLQCQARHLQLNASGTPEQIDATLDFNLAGLMQEASQLIDLGTLTLAGNGHGRFQWRRQSQQEYAANGILQVNGFRLALDDTQGWSEKELRLQLDAQGPIGNTSAVSIGAGKAQLFVGEDQVTATLAEPVNDLMNAASYPIDFHSQGDLARWAIRLKTLMPMGDLQTAGQFTATGRIDYSFETPSVRDAKVRVQQLTIRSPQLNFSDPDAELSVGLAKWSSSQNRLEIRSAALAGQTIGVGVEPFTLAWADGKIGDLNGTVAVRTTLERIQQWTSATLTTPPQWTLAGNLAAQSTFQTTKGNVTFNADSVIEQFVAHHHSGKKLEEPSIRLIAKGKYDPEANQLELANAKLESGLVAADANGKFDLAKEKPRIDLDGQYQYDLVRLSEVGRAQFGIPLFAAGKNVSPFSYHGPISLAEAQARLGLTWTGAEIAGFLFGPGKLDAQLIDGIAQTSPIDLNVSEGRVNLTPHLTFSDQGSVLTVEPGQIAQRIRISPRMCAGALQYIAPPLAGVATAEGTFSIEMENCRVPLDDPSKGDLSGRMIVHAVSIGPGPLIRELATALGFGKTAQLSRESVVPFRMVEGRVYHRDLELVFPEVTMKTYGSVGLDQSLALMVEMPIPAKWRTGNPILDNAVQNKTIRIPIGGSLQRPAVDQRELERQAGQFLQGAVQNVLQNQLNRLFQPK